MRALLDVNVIIALLDESHVFNKSAHDWWVANGNHGWARCPLTENGVIRVMSNPGYSKHIRLKPGDLVASIQQFINCTDHEFWPDDISFCDEKSFAVENVHSSSLLTNLFLLGLAAKHKGRLITFDRGIPLSAARNATAENLMTL